ncbi:DUF6886 family protein [Bacillus sp. DJP31]|uniref:DUF6886 family protein n=1 Tax=Bacillus sp. DJP31 TaxID=3409789 RepID=UPI003BB57698
MHLFHFSEDSSIRIFHPRPHPTHPNLPNLVWAIDEDRSPMYLVPRDCPRIAYWPVHSTSLRRQRAFL